MSLPALLGACALVTWAAVAPVRAEVALVMVEQEGCVWCARWDAEIAPAYPKTELGRTAPLRRVDLDAPLPDDLDLTSPPRLTPTFILTDDGTELARVEGYPGPDFFWAVTERMLEEAGIPLVPDEAAPPAGAEAGAETGTGSN